MSKFVEESKERMPRATRPGHAPAVAECVAAYANAVAEGAPLAVRFMILQALAEARARG